VHLTTDFPLSAKLYAIGARELGQNHSVGRDIQQGSQAGEARFNDANDRAIALQVLVVSGLMLIP
jgi:hypothetical protein